MIFLDENDKFPAVDKANKNVLLAFSNNLNIRHLLEAYHNGIFPWYNKGDLVLWWSPNLRMILFP